jgi:hypothetical protein
MMLLDQLVGRATRRRALETALAAYVLLDESLAERIGTLPLSGEPIVLLNVIIGEPQMAKVALVPCVRVALRTARNLPSGVSWLDEQLQHFLADDRARPRDVLRLARDIARVTVQDLSAVGTFGLVVDLLASERSPAVRLRAQHDHIQRATTLRASPWHGAFARGA